MDWYDQLSQYADVIVGFLQHLIDAIRAFFNMNGA